MGSVVESNRGPLWRDGSCTTPLQLAGIEPGPETADAGGGLIVVAGAHVASPTGASESAMGSNHELSDQICGCGAWPRSQVQRGCGDDPRPPPVSWIRDHQSVESHNSTAKTRFAFFSLTIRYSADFTTVVTTTGSQYRCRSQVQRGSDEILTAAGSCGWWSEPIRCRSGGDRFEPQNPQSLGC